MPTGLLFECDNEVAQWVFNRYRFPQMKFDKALGLVDKEGKFVGAVIFQCWNGFNVEMSYYSLKPVLSAGLTRCLARYVLFTFKPSRVTVTTSRKNKSLMRGLQKMGFKLEGAQQCYYGHRNCNRNTAIRFVMFRDRIEQLALLPMKKEQNVC